MAKQNTSRVRKANQHFKRDDVEVKAHLQDVAEKHACASFVKDEGLVIELGMYLSGTKLAPELTETFRRGGAFRTVEGMKPAQSITEVMHAVVDIHSDYNHEIFDHVIIRYAGRDYKFRDVFFDQDHGSDFLHQLSHLDVNHRKRPFILCARPYDEIEAQNIGGYKNLRNGRVLDHRAFRIPSQPMRAETAGGIDVSVVPQFDVWHDDAIMEQMKTGQPIVYLGTLMGKPDELLKKIEGIDSGSIKDRRIFVNFRIGKIDNIAPIKWKTLSPSLQNGLSLGAAQDEDADGQVYLPL